MKLIHNSYAKNWGRDIQLARRTLQIHYQNIFFAPYTKIS